MSSIRSPNTVPWPQPVVTVRRSMRLGSIAIAVAGGDGDGVDLPVDLDGGDLVKTGDQALVAQVADGQCFRRAAEGHQGDDLALVDVERQRMFAGDGGGNGLPVLVDGIDGEGERARSLGEERSIHRERFYTRRKFRLSCKAYRFRVPP